jgi:hypothetical protein
VTLAFETPRRRRSNATIVVVGLAALAAVMTFLVTGITLVALAIAFPIALPFAEQFSIYVTPRDVEIATQFASISWVFGVLGIASVAAAVVTTVATVRYLSPTDER